MNVDHEALERLALLHLGTSARKLIRTALEFIDLQQERQRRLERDEQEALAWQARAYDVFEVEDHELGASPVLRSTRIYFFIFASS